MPELNDIEDLKEVKIGDLNDISFSADDPLVTNEHDGRSLISNMLSSFWAVHHLSTKKGHIRV